MTRFLISTALAGLLALGSPASAGEPERGAEAFANFCAACHGMGAEGDGPMAAILSIRPPNLTMLSASNGGVFPLDRVIRRIDGTTEVMAHGGPMPLFGLVLEGPSDVILAPDGSEVIAPEMIVNIAEWLQTIQEGG